MSFNRQRKTILASNQEEDLSADHPLFYVRERSKYLDRLTEQTSRETQLPTIDLRRNMRIDHYIDKYNLLRAQQQKQLRIKNSFLSTSQFQSIFQNQEQKLRQQRREQKQSKKMQDQLYQNYIEEVNIYQQPEHDFGQSGEPQTVLQMGNKNKMRQLYLLDIEIGKLKYEERLDQLSKQRKQSCQNMTLVSKLSNTLISSYLVHFDQIVGLLLDEILQDQVIFLNHLEADYRVDSSWKQQTLTTVENKQTLQMIELVKSLEDLCDS